MDLLERERELSELSDMLAECASGSTGTAIMVSSGIGCGKSHFLEALKGWAEGKGFVVLAAAGAWSEQGSPGSVLGQLLWCAVSQDRLGSSLRMTLERLKLAHRSSGSGAPAGRPAPSAASVLHRLSREILGIAAQAPILICIDDNQFTDSLSLHWLQLLVRSLPTARIALVLSGCHSYRTEHPWLAAELLRLPRYRRIVLKRLSCDGAAELLAQQLGAETARALAADFYQVSLGNPLLLRALIEDFRHSAHARHGSAPQMVVGEAYAEAVLGCLHRDQMLMRLAQAIAVLDDDASADEVLARLLADEQPMHLERGLAALDAAGLLDGKRLRHPMARSAILGSLSSRQCSDLHRRAAKLLYEGGAAATSVSRHLLAADEGQPEPWAVPVLRETAERYLSDNQAEAAHLCLEAAHRACDDAGSRTALRALMADAAWLMNPSIGARHLGELTAALRDGRLSGQAAAVLARYLLWHGRFEEAAGPVEQLSAGALDDNGTIAVDVVATRMLLSASYPALVPPPGASEPDREEPQLRPCAATGLTSTDPRVRSAESLLRVIGHGPSDGVVADAEIAMRAMRLAKNTQEWLVCGVAALTYADRLDRAARWCDHWLSEAHSQRVPRWEAEFASLRASISLRQGDPKGARQLTEAALAHVPAEGWGVCVGDPLANLLHSVTEIGDLEAGAALLKIPVTDGTFGSRSGARYLNARGCYYLEARESWAALQDFVACGNLLKEWCFDQPSLIPWRAGAARAYLSLGEPQKAHRIAHEQLVLAGTGATRTRAISLRVLAAASDSAQRAALLTEAVEIFARCGDRLQLARTFADLGRAHAVAGRREQADSVIDMACRLAEECGAESLLCSLHEEYGRTDCNRRGNRGGAEDHARALDLLSRAEHRVAALAAHGHTNRQIAGQLFITVSTVEQHLTSAFRKLGVKKRKELPRELVLNEAVS
jgi:DNA-binding CsgD family transcriptional regulator